MPPIITGLALLIFFREIELDRSLVTIIIGHTVFVLALVYRTIADAPPVAEREPRRGLLRSRRQRVGRPSGGVLPNLSSAMAGAAILAFALSFDETMITLLVTGTQCTLPVRLWAMMRLGFTPDINALVALISCSPPCSAFWPSAS